MTQRENISKWFLYALVTGLFVLLQSVVLNRISIWNVHPFLPPMLVAMVAMWEGRGAGIGFALVFGFLTDLTANAPIPCFYMVLFVLIALMTSVIARRLFPAGFLCALVLAVLAMLPHALFTALLLDGQNGLALSAAVSLAGRELVVSAPFVLLFYWPYRRVYRTANQN